MWLFEANECKRIPAEVRSEVYKRARGHCENSKCLNKTIFLSEHDGRFHHTRPPKNVPTAKSVRFLCEECHNAAHGYKIKKSPFGIEGKRVIVRRDPTRKSKAKSKPKPSKKKAGVMSQFGLPTAADYRRVFGLPSKKRKKSPFEF